MYLNALEVCRKEYLFYSFGLTVAQMQALERGRITGTLVREESYYANLCARGRPNGQSRRRAVARGLKWKITDAVTVQVSVTNGLIIIICFKHSLTFLLAKLRWRIAERDDHGSACRLRPLESAMYRTGGWSRRR